MYLVMVQKKHGIKPLTVFRSKSEAEFCADNHRTPELDSWVEVINFHE